jgi:hypothetical protein
MLAAVIVLAVIVLAATVLRVEIAAGAADAPAAVDVIVAAEAAVDVPVAAVATAVVAGRAGEGTNFFATRFRGFARINTKGHGESRGLLYGR